MKKLFPLALAVTSFLILVFLAHHTTQQSFADPYDCQHFGTMQCIDLHVSAVCTNGKPVVTLSWNNPHNDSTFNIVYDHDGHWYMQPIWSKVLSTTIPPYGGHQDGGSGGDPGFSTTGGYFAAKITGGIPGSLGGGGITTGYSTPDVSTTMPDCTTPPTNTPTPTLSPTQGPQNTPTPTPTSAPVPHTYLNLALRLPGIGIGGNLSPKHPTRTIHLSIYAKDVDPTQPNVTPVYDNKTLTVLFNANNGFFTNPKADIGTTLPTGSYQIFIKTSGYLRKQVLDAQENKAITITEQKTNTIPSVKLIAGDVALLYNVMDITDFYAITDCYGSKASGSTCKAGDVITDINDDGVVDGIDINYWLLGLQQLQQTNNPEGNGDGPVGE
ncbi:MAG TPA: hypothetical protein VFQ63_03110 [Patescibacteria group bacterium]|nr:hypothetical protein [Patescibacteria group bacterium]